MKELNGIERFLSGISPMWGARRLAAKNLGNIVKQNIRKYEAAAGGRRTDSWITTSSSAATEIQVALSRLRNRSRDLVRNNPYAKNAIRKIANNVVGTGIIPTPSGNSKLQEKKTKQLWKQWAETTQCDYDGHLNFYGIQKLVMRTVAESGECLVRKRISKDSKLLIPLQLQVLEPDFIDTTKHSLQLSKDGTYIFYGIEFSKEGKITGYWLYETHPGDAINFNFKSNLISADEISHIFEKERPGQFRGVPMMHASMLRMRDLDEYEDAQLIRQKIAACFSVFITDSNTGIPSGVNENELTEKVEPGIIQRLAPGQSATFASPPAAEGYSEYTKDVLRAIAAGIGMDYVTLTGDLTAVNFSSGRMGWLEFNRNVAEWQWQMLIPMFCEKAWNWFAQFAAIYGAINIDKLTTVTWTPPRREMIDPAKEVSAQLDAIQGGLYTWSDVQLENGFVPEDQIEKMIRDKEAFEKAGLPIYTSKPAMGAKEAKPVDNTNDTANSNNQ